MVHTRALVSTLLYVLNAPTLLTQLPYIINTPNLSPICWLNTIDSSCHIFNILNYNLIFFHGSPWYIDSSA
jgi:hypothetical protein